MTAHQLPYHIAECGAKVPVQQLSPWEFAWQCPCGESGWISWAHAAPPPTFAPPAPTLFDPEEKQP